MQAIRSLLRYLYGNQGDPNLAEYPLDYDNVTHLDAEDLAEEGIRAAYLELLPQLRRYKSAPLEVTEELDSENGSYAVIAGGERYEIWGPDLNANEGWPRAAAAFFIIVNRNLAEAQHKFYALYGGNDLSGIFLTEEELLLARKAIKRPSDWPYMPIMRAPHYGFPTQD